MFIQNQNLSHETTFAARVNQKKKLEQVRNLFNKEFHGIDSPSKYQYMNSNDFDKQHLYKLNSKLEIIRDLLAESFYPENSVNSFKEKIGLIKMMKVANCSEFSDLGNLVLKLNNINCDRFILCKKAKDNKIQQLDHELLGINIPKSKNNKSTKKTGVPFRIKDKTKLVDFWFGGKICNGKIAKKVYKQFGILPTDELYLKPVVIDSISKEQLPGLKQEYSQYLLKK